MLNTISTTKSLEVIFNASLKIDKYTCTDEDNLDIEDVDGSDSD